MEIQTRIFRDISGWHAESRIDLPNQRVLKIRTGKRSIGAGLQSTATVWSDTGDGCMRHAMGLGTGQGDFSETLMLTHPRRVTEQAVSDQHERVLQQENSLREQIKQFYALQGQEHRDETVSA